MLSRWRQFCFSPPLWATLVTFALIAVALSAAAWQWSKAQSKAERLRQLLYQQRQPPSAAERWLRQPPPLYTSMIAKGRWVPEQAIWLDNKIRQAPYGPGRELIMPLRLDASNRLLLLVNRGWAPYPVAQQLNIAQLGGNAQVTGRAVQPSLRFIELSSDVIDGTVWQNLTLDRFERHFGVQLLPFVVEETGTDEAPLSRNWPAADLGRERNLGYTLHWIALAVTVATIFVLLNLKRQTAPRGAGHRSASSR